MLGLPPQVRGALVLIGTMGIVLRLTPAGAGSTSSESSPTTPPWAYPRRCGEHSWAAWIAGLFGGLPPQVRGALRGRRWCAATNRLTPAGAGSTSCSLLTPGEARGLPPQVRGAPSTRRPEPSPQGLTPAGAGSTHLILSGRSRSRAYPRRCGEHGPAAGIVGCRQGLPPQVRGAQRRSGGSGR